MPTVTTILQRMPIFICFLSLFQILIVGEQVWCSGKSYRLPPIWPRFDLIPNPRCICGLSLFVGSLLCPEKFFLGSSGFPFSPKTNINFDLICCDSV